MTNANQLALQLAEKIIQFCITNELERGTRLTERKLGVALGVSRSPIRSARKILEERGVLERSESGFVLACDVSDLAKLSLDAPPTAAEGLCVQMLRDRFAGKLREQVSEADLLRQYDVTRSTLTKVLMRLNREGYITRSAGRGWIFHEILGSVETYRTSYEFRQALEPAALGSPNYRIDKARVQRLLDRHLALRDAGPEKIDGADWFNLDAELHEMLVDFSGNEHFLRAIRNQNHLRGIVEIESFYADERVKESLEEHIAILQTLLRDDREWAATLLMRHLQLASESTEVFLTRG